MTSIKLPEKVDPVTRWADEVANGRIVAGPHIVATAKRHLADLERGHERGLVFDAKAAQEKIDFFPRHFRLTEGRFDGRAFELAPSQAFRVGSLFGWKRDDGSRRFRRFYDEEGKGNGKSPLLAGLGLIGLAADKEAGAQVYAGAATKEQAKVLFGDAVNMARHSPSLSGHIKVLGGTGPRELRIRSAQGDVRFFKMLSREDRKSGSGPRPHFVLMDEIHEHPDGDLLDIAERGFKFRQQPLIAMATNAGHDRTSICWAERAHAVAVAQGEIEDDAHFPFVCSLDEGEDPLEDEACWLKANPLLGTTITADYLRGVVKQARQMPAKRNNILRLHFCVWTESHTVWITRPVVEAAEDEAFDLNEFDGQPAVMGLDLGKSRDPSALSLVFRDGTVASGPHAGKPKYAAWTHAYVAEGTLGDRDRSEEEAFRQWIAAGHVTGTPGDKVQLEFMAEHIAEHAGRFDIETVAYDAWMWESLQEVLERQGCHLPMVVHPQGFNRKQGSPLWMPQSIEHAETLFLEGRLRLAVSPALRSAIMSVAMVTSPAGLRRFTKSRAGRRIDLCIALVNGIGAAVANLEQEAPVPNYLETRDFIIA